MMTNSEDKRFFSLSDYFREKFGEKVYKVTIDAGFSCPNRDGVLSSSGCLFCDDSGSFSQAHSNLLSVSQQVQIGISNLQKRFKANKFLAYFQAFSNTYKPVSELKKIYDEALSADENVIGLSIGTRPDCLDEKKLDLIADYSKEKEVWLELGLQSANNETLQRINRHHSYECFENACNEAKKRNIKVCAHVILSLMGETHEDMMHTAKSLGKLEIEGIKIHMLCVLKNTKLEKLYRKTPFRLFTEDEYVETVCDFLEYLPSSTVVHRLGGNGLSSSLLEPKWLRNKFRQVDKVNLQMRKRNSFQGKNFNLISSSHKI